MTGKEVFICSAYYTGFCLEEEKHLRNNYKGCFLEFPEELRNHHIEWRIKCYPMVQGLRYIFYELSQLILSRIDNQAYIDALRSRYEGSTGVTDANTLYCAEQEANRIMAEMLWNHEGRKIRKEAEIKADFKDLEAEIKEAMCL